MKKTRKHYTIFLALLIAALVFSLAAPPCAEALGRGIHQDMAEYAKMLANNNLFSEDEKDVPEWMKEINQYVPDIDLTTPSNKSGVYNPDAYALTQGASHEDETDHVYGRTGIFDACVTITHFWDPDDGPDSTNDSGACHFNDPNAWQKASRLWGMALGQYYIGNKASAYEYLGHVVHLLGDMTVPAHAHYDMHFDEDRYDDCFINGQCPNTNAENQGPEYLTGPERFNVKQLEMVQIPEGTGLYWLFYTTAQVADYYPSDGEPGDANDPFYEPDLVDFSLLDPLPGGIGSDQIDGCDCDDATASCTIGMETIRENSYSNGIRAVAALYKLFHDTVTQQGELTVYLKSVTTLEEGDVPPPPPAFWDDPDYFVNVFIGNLVNGERRGLLNFNKGELTDPVAEGETSPLPITSGSNGWAFAYVFDPAAPIRVEIELWDDDSLEGCPDNFEQYDIYTNPDNTERALWLDVNLEACKAGTPGAITGDITTTCRVQIVSPGDDVPYSQIEFYIIPPNSPPVADAGPDQEVNEGDWVTLNGTFTDPDPEDTHTFLWELVSSSNGQPVSDSTAQSLSFEPCDNGVYTFSFTVTDNHGAQGSDSVVVTALNVPPVVSAPYIFNQENAEFILPVVHNTEFKGMFTDAGKCDSHTALWDWGDGKKSNGVVSELSGSGSVTNAHTYSLPGDYTVMLIVTDDDLGHDSNTIIDQVHVADAGEALDIFNEYIQGLNSNKFKNSAKQRKAAFNNMFRSLDNMLAVKDYRGMICSMNSNIRTKFDGLVGGNPKDDWIINNLAVQTDLCRKVDDITEYLQYLLSTMP